jgi:2-polyprenyl-3-methyl-5-hydroxy-6-metoxy-1,4-benzoquinol methylase
MTSFYQEIKCCRACKSKDLHDVLSFGDLFVSNFLDNESDSKNIRAPLTLCFCSFCSLLQLRHSVHPDKMFRNYWYRSGINSTMTKELSDITNESIKKVELKSGDFLLDIGANDGTLLRSYLQEKCHTIGFEPAENLCEVASQGTTKIINNYFSADIWFENFPEKKAKIITAIGMFYDLEDPNSFLNDITQVLDSKGIFVIQMMYLPFFIKRNAFDGVCHEHLEYYSLQSLEYILNKNKLKIFDIQVRESINEGSLRFFICHDNDSTKSILNGIIDILRSAEKELKLTGRKTYNNLFERIILNKKMTVNFIKKVVSEGKIVHGYAASTKGNTTLQFYELTKNEIPAIADKNPSKFGLFAPGAGIKVISEEESRNLKPDYFFVLAWHFIDEFIEREIDFLNRGGKFILSMPEFKIIGKNEI